MENGALLHCLCLASPSDYSLPEGNQVITDNTSVVCVTLTVPDDNVAESNETLRVAVCVSNDGAIDCLDAAMSTHVTIIDDDSMLQLLHRMPCLCLVCSSCASVYQFTGISL